MNRGSTAQAVSGKYSETIYKSSYEFLFLFLKTVNVIYADINCLFLPTLTRKGTVSK